MRVRRLHRFLRAEVPLVGFVAGALLFIRLGFIRAGYGVEPDAWRVARCALDLAESGTYAVSRFPGYPIHEFVCAALARWGAAGLNGAGAIMSLVAFVFFFRSLLRVRARAPLATAAVLTLIPVVLIASVTAKDYVWGLALILAAHDLILTGRPRMAGIALGLAIGTRLTHVIMLPPLMILIAADRPARARAGFAAAALLVGAACFAPVFLRYGLSFLRYADGGSYPSLSLVAYRFGYGVWGLPGMAGIVLAGVGTLAGRGRRREFMLRLRVMPRRELAGWGLAAALPMGLFLMLPHQAGYLIPSLPFLMLLAARLLPVGCLALMLGCIAASPFLGGISPGFEPAARRPAGALDVRAGGREFWITGAGPIFIDNERRRLLIGIGESALHEAHLPGGVIVAGWWLPQIQVQGRAEWGNIGDRFVYEIRRDEARGAGESPRGAIRVMPGQRAFNLRMHGIDLADYGARPLPEGME